MTIRELQAKLVKALEEKRDTAPILRQIAEEKARQATGADLAEAEKIARERQELKDKAEKVTAKVERQGKAIDAFLEARSALLERLEPLVEPLQELAGMGAASWERGSGECYLYNDHGQFTGAVRGIPREMLPDGFSCPTLAMLAPGETSYGKAEDASRYLQYAVGILQSYTKGAMPAITREGDDSLLLDGEPELTGGCLVCQHERLDMINDALQDERPLRELEAEYNVSRSTLSRHKNRCLKLVRIAENAV